MSTATPDHPRATEAPGPAPVPPGRRRPWLALAIVLAVLLLVAWGFWRAAQPAPVFPGPDGGARDRHRAQGHGAHRQGAGHRRQKIQPGDLLVEMDSPEVRAKLAQAEAPRCRPGPGRQGAGRARPPEVQMARLNWQRPDGRRPGPDLAAPRASLFDQGLVAAQKRDEADANWRASRDQALAARAV
jgi:HlyD family secretion protein